MFSNASYLHQRYKQWRHGRIARAVLATPPVKAIDDGVILFSMIGTRVLMPFLVAAKSLHGRLGRGRFVVMDDGSLTAGDRALLRRHLDDPEILSIRAVETGPCPEGGTWERLLTILDRRARHYVIQLDSDTVTRGPLPEVEAAIKSGRSFTLRGEADAELLAIRDFARARAPQGEGKVHVQQAIEAQLDRLDVPGLAEPRYVRGCSGFAGFAPSGAGRALAEAFSVEAERLLGRARWAEWGSEQVTSNFVIANEPDPLLLPYDRYLNFWDEGLPPDRRFVHFIGTCRFRGNAYADETRAAIAALGRPEPAPAASAALRDRSA